MKKKISKISNGTLGYQDYKLLIQNKFISSLEKIPEESIQPASIDLRLGNSGYEISSSFLAINEKSSISLCKSSMHLEEFKKKFFFI